MLSREDNELLTRISAGTGWKFDVTSWPEAPRDAMSAQPDRFFVSVA